MPLKPNFKEAERIRTNIGNHGLYLSADLFLSPAYLTLHDSSQKLLFMFSLEANYDIVKREKHYKDNGKIGFSETKYRRLFKCSSQTYYNPRDQLITNGFIIQTIQGGYGPGDYAKYKLLFLPDVPERHQRWRKFPDKTYEKDIPKRKLSSLGEKTRFKKGVANRTVKTTLKE